MTESECAKALSQLGGLPLRTIGRACNLLWLQFGQWREVPERRGGTKTVGQWALHVQGEWSLSRLGKPVTSNADYYVNEEGQDLGDHWDTPGNSQFDAIATRLRAHFESSPPLVTSVKCGPQGAFSLDFNDGTTLDVSPGRADGEESWRLFQPATDARHFVVS